MKLVVNGKSIEVAAPADTPLLWVLREEVGLTGTKFGCGKALCGACTVHVDGKPKRSCVTAVGDIADKPITTIEGLATEAALHPVQQAWIEENVPQCGYCQSGQIMSAVVLLRAKPKPTDAEIDDAMSANLCRCGTYPRIRKAVHRAAELMGSAAAPAPAPKPAAPAPAPAAAAPAAPAPAAPASATPAAKPPASATPAAKPPAPAAPPAAPAPKPPATPAPTTGGKP